MSHLFAIVATLGVIFGLGGGGHALYEIHQYEQIQEATAK
jgi:hypothetical protein